MENQGVDKNKVLIIEDDFDLVWMINKLLEIQGYEVLTAVTASQGIDFFCRYAFQIKAVVLDLTLPDARGEDIVFEIFKVFPEMPVIITTGFEDRKQKTKLLHRGVAAYLVKPYDLSKLVRILTELN